MKEITKFLYNPNEIEVLEDFAISNVILKFFKFFLIVSLSFGLLFFVFNKLFDIESFIQKKEFPNQKLANYFFKIVLFYPVIEELGFRLLLRVKRQFLSISLSIQIVIVIAFFDLIKLDIFGFLFLASTLYLVLILTVNDWILEKIRLNYKLYFYCTLILFALLHSYNYHIYNKLGYLLIIFYLLPPLVFGLYFGYVRLKYGFIYAVLLHIAYNLILFIPKVTANHLLPN